MKKIKLPFDLRMELLEERQCYEAEALPAVWYEPVFLCAKGLGEFWELPKRLPQTMWFHVTGYPYQDATFMRPIYYHEWDASGCPFSGLLFERSVGYQLYPHRPLARLLEELCTPCDYCGLFVALQYEEES